MISMKSALIAGLAIAPLTFGAAYASSPDEFTLQPMGVDTSSSTIIYSPQTTTTSGSTIVTQPAAGNGQFENVNINDYIIQDNTTNSQ